MQIVIDIQRELYEQLMESNADDFDGFIEGELVGFIQNGTALPKEHGALKDIGQCDRKLFYQQCGGADSLITVKSAFDMLMALPTIIEADKTESEDKK